jgi:hypothetical protein
MTLPGGVPEMVGAVLGAAFTVMEKGASETESAPSLAEMVIPENVPTFDPVGVPDRRPVDVLKVAHEGLLMME